MKTLFLLFLTLLNWPLFGYEVKVRVVDESGAPVVGAKASIYFVNSIHDDQRDGVTDANGVFAARGKGTDSVGCIVTKDGHYPARVERLSREMDHNVEVVLPRILNPVPLYAVGKIIPTFPVQNQWVGFDFEKADWVAPHGEGRTADILFRFKNEFKGWNMRPEELEERMRKNKSVYAARNEEWSVEKFKIVAGKWDGVMEISFPNEGEGIFEETRFLDYSTMKLPHMAPTDGYVPTWRYEAFNYHYPTVRDKVGFFLRTRVKRDEQGKVISANYAKIVRDFQVAASKGNVAFSYYFNPVPNSRNLEFSPKDNLMKEPKHDGRVFNIGP